MVHLRYNIDTSLTQIHLSDQSLTKSLVLETNDREILFKTLYGAPVNFSKESKKQTLRSRSKFDEKIITKMKVMQDGIAEEMITSLMIKGVEIDIRI
jgi:hypothetical protein